MSEETMLTIKWLNSDDSDEWRQKNFRRIWRPLMTVVRDGDASSLMGEWQMLWVVP